MTKEETALILMSLGKLEAGQTDLKLQFTNHLEHHRQDSIREVACLRKWIWVCIPTVITLFLAVVGAAYYLGRTN